MRQSSDSEFLHKLIDHLLGLRGVVSAEEVVVVENVIKIVKFSASLPTGVTWPGVVVGDVEGGWEASEKFGEGEVGLAIAVVAGRIKDDRGSISGEAGVATPKVSVKQRGNGAIVAEEVGEVIEKAISIFEADALVLRELELPVQALFAPEVDPVGVGLIGLKGGTDEVAGAPAVVVVGCKLPVQGGELGAHRCGIGGVATWN